MCSQGPTKINKGAFFTGTWGATREGGLATQDILPPSTLLSWGNDSTECALQGARGQLSPAVEHRQDGYIGEFGHDGTTYAGPTYVGPASTASTPKIQASQPALQSFYLPQTAGTNGSDFEEITL